MEWIIYAPFLIVGLVLLCFVYATWLVVMLTVVGLIWDLLIVLYARSVGKEPWDSPATRQAAAWD